MAVVTLVPAGVLAWRSWGLATRAAEVRQEETLSREALALATFSDGWLDAQAASLKGWHRVWDLDARDATYRIGLARAVYRAMDSTVTVALVDEAGRPVVKPQYLEEGQAPPGRVPGDEARAETLLQHLPAPSPDGVAIGRPYIAPGARHPSVAMLAGTPDERLRLAAEISLHVLERTMQSDPKVAAVLVDDVGRAVVGDVALLEAVAGLRGVAGLGGDTTFSADVGGATVRGATARLPFRDWTMVVVHAGRDASTLGVAIRDEALRIGGIVLVVLLVVGVVLDRTLARTVQALIAHANQIRDGHYGARNRIQRSDELGELAEAVDEMAARLEHGRQELVAAYDELAGFNEELQSRVEARTHDLKEAQSQLVRAAQTEAVAEVGAGLSHELNNPLSIILAQVELARARGEGDPEALARIENAARRCREVVATMRSLVSGDVDARRSPVVDLHDVVREAHQAVTATLQERGSTLTVDLDGACPAHAERAVLGRALRTFLETQAQLGGRGSVIRVTAADGGVRIALHRPRGDEHADDERRAGGVRLWGARRLAELSGVRLEPEDEQERVWRLQAEVPA